MAVFHKSDMRQEECLHDHPAVEGSGRARAARPATVAVAAVSLGNPAEVLAAEAPALVSPGRKEGQAFLAPIS
jgi:hypothetical protein